MLEIFGLKFKRFLGGIHVDHLKGQTENKLAEKIPMPKELYLYLSQHIGKSSETIVKAGDEVKKGQMIAKASALVSVPLHAPTSGKIKAITEHVHPTLGKGMCIVLETDGHDSWAENVPLATARNWRELFPEDLIAIVRDAGIVGLGGAGFPTHVKLSPPAGTVVDTVLINGAECEPYLTSDDLVMRERSNEVVTGIEIIMKITGAKKCIVGIERNKPRAIEAIEKAIKAAKLKDVSVMSLAAKYPQGAERNLIKSITGIDLAFGKLPLHEGIIVVNSTTTYAIEEAVVKGIPLIEKVVTVAGTAVNTPKNVLAPIGTRWEDILNFCGGKSSNIGRLVMGGPMMGAAQVSYDAAVIKGCGGLLAFKEDDIEKVVQGPCIRCGRCIAACSSGLNPCDFAYLVETRQWDKAEEAGLLKCTECGACSFECPANRFCINDAKILKNKIKEKFTQVK